MKSEEEGVTSLDPSRGFWTAELCLGLPAEVDQHWSGGVAPSLTLCLCWRWAACSPFNTNVVQMGTLLNVTKGGLSQEHKSVYKIEKISSVCLLFIYIYSICLKKKLYKH